jgi:hypothetical protein
VGADEHMTDILTQENDESPGAQPGSAHKQGSVHLPAGGPSLPDAQRRDRPWSGPCAPSPLLPCIRRILGT